MREIRFLKRWQFEKRIFEQGETSLMSEPMADNLIADGIAEEVRTASFIVHRDPGSPAHMAVIPTETKTWTTR